MKGEAEAAKITSDIWKNIDAVQKTAVKTDPFPKESGSATVIVGTYSDKWFGDVVISEKGGKLWFQSVRSYLISGEMFPYKGNTYVAKWTDRSLDADVFVQFSMDMNGKAAGFKMEAISPLTDFSFDFQDLEFVKK